MARGRKRIRDEFTARTDLSRQQKYQLRAMRDGKCKQCRNKALPKLHLCSTCHEKHLNRTRSYVPKNPQPQDLI